jgi:hypothetical protein
MKMARKIPIYMDNGYKIQRRLAIFNRNTKPHGVLIDLRNVGSLFHSDDMEELFDSEAASIATQYHVYPQAGLVSAGHFQADGLPSAVQKLLDLFNNELLDEINEDMDNSVTAPPIVGVACQAYNAVMHATRGRSAQHHDAQKGLITSAMAGAWASTPKTKGSADRLKNKCSEMYPHHEFRQKISRDAICRDLRLENVFTIDVKSLPQEMQDGGCVILTLYLSAPTH